MNRLLPRALMAPAVLTLFLWMIVPLAMTLYFSFVNYNLMQPGEHPFAGIDNFHYFVTDPDFWPSVGNTLLLIGSVIAATVVLGIGLALLIDAPFPGRGIVRVLLISPFFVMPTVNALLWKHMMMNPIYGILADVWRFFGAEPVDWMADWPLLSVIIMVAWQWLPFACLIFMTSLQSLDREQMEAARMDGAGPFQRFFYLVLPHLARPMAVVKVLEAIRNSVCSGARSSSTASSSCPSTLETKWKCLPGAANSASACTAICGPRSEPPMPMFTTSVMVWSARTFSA